MFGKGPPFQGPFVADGDGVRQVRNPNPLEKVCSRGVERGAWRGGAKGVKKFHEEVQVVERPSGKPEPP